MSIRKEQIKKLLLIGLSMSLISYSNFLKEPFRLRRAQKANCLNIFLALFLQIVISPQLAFCIDLESIIKDRPINELTCLQTNPDWRVI